MKIILITLTLLALAVSNQQKPSSEPYSYIEYTDIVTLAETIRKSPLFGKIFDVYDGFQEYKIDELPKCGNEGQFCKNPIFEITALSKGPEFVSTLPVVLLVAGMHGNEVLGSNAMYRLIQMFDRFYTSNDYFKLLIENVRLMIVPMSNAYGFSNKDREEKVAANFKVDPNRDFPYDAIQCMQSSTARMLDAIYSNHLVVGTITYHGGDNSITYPWGNFPHERDQESKDHVAFVAIANMLKQAAGKNDFLEIREFSTATMSNGVYSVRGGFEDYAYGAGFDFKNVNKKCDYKTADQKTKQLTMNYEKNGPRAFVYLIEAADSKRPDENTLGNESLTMLEKYDDPGFGHLNRCINLALRYAQTMKSFVHVTEISADDSAILLAAEVYGCVTLDEIVGQGMTVELVSKEYSNRRNKWTVSLRVPSKRLYLSNIDFTVKCDSEYQSAVEPESHFLRLKTGRFKEIKSGFSNLKSFETMSVKVIGIARESLSTALIKWSQNNVHSLIYSSSLTLNGAANLVFENGQLTLKSTEFEAVKIVDFEDSGVSVKGPVTPLVELKNSTPIDFSQQLFLDLPGKIALLYDKADSNTPTAQTIIRLNFPVLGGLTIPESGLIAKLSSPAPRAVILINQVDQSTFAVKIVSKMKAIQNFASIDGLQLPPFKEETQSLSYGLHVIQRTYKVASDDQFLLNGRIWELTDSIGTTTRFSFAQRNKWQTEAQLVSSHFQTREAFSPIIIPMVIFLSLFVLLGTALMVASKSKNIIREPLDAPVAALQMVN